METVMSRIGRLLGMRMHSANRTMHSVSQSPEEAQRNAPTFKVEATSKRKKSVLLKPKYMKLNESIDQVNKLRADGLTYRLIGEHLKMSKQRVYQIILAGKQRDTDRDLWTYGLSVRNTNLMNKLGITSNDSARVAVLTGEIAPFRWPNFGRKSYTDLCKWLGVEPIESKPNANCPHCGKQTK